MTIEQAIGMSASELESMTDAQLHEHFSHYLVVSRPENSIQQKAKEQRVAQANPEFERARQIAASVGIIIPSYINKGKRK